MYVSSFLRLSSAYQCCPKEMKQEAESSSRGGASSLSIFPVSVNETISRVGQTRESCKFIR